MFLNCYWLPMPFSELVAAEVEAVKHLFSMDVYT